MPTRTPPPILVEPVDGPEISAIDFGDSTYVTFGRSSEAGVTLDHHAVSRQHMAVLARDASWFAMDIGSRNGTKLNGLTLPRGEPTPLADLDHLQIGPWTFRVRVGTPGTPVAAATIDDQVSATPRLRTTGIAETEAGLRAQIASLMRASSVLHSARTEKDMLALLLEAAQGATGFERAAVLRRTSRADQVEVVAQRAQGDARGLGSSSAPFSRSLIRAASDGPSVVLSDTGSQPKPETLLRFDIAGAACAPIRLGEAPWGFLYLDSGAGTPPTRTSETLEIVRGLADIASMALASIKQREVQGRLDTLHTDLEAAAEIQRFLLPDAHGCIGGVPYALWSRPGRIVSGDLFSITPCPDGCVAVFLGDVMGKGLGAGLIMAGVVAYLQCLLGSTIDPAEALSRLNTYMCPRLNDGRFVSLWLGIVDPSRGTLTAADAGHGYAMRVRDQGIASNLSCSGGTPLGAVTNCTYATTCVEFNPSDRLLLFSDGVVEQRSSPTEVFGLKRLIESLQGSRSAGEDVARIAEAITGFTGAAMPSDDVTAASVCVRPG